ncbi:Calcium-transporting ATPase 4, plasma membrane-type [Porphyridium purpureum]|uniref:P-type Ca(2+) transporter n=1 Tax=Porphyridium purpureum TaxID=35688 RepID=A0A5J4YSA1_PORPP|nr:Calcium-transporting ATPase 4, plasma membrane-type [Porphyridium purpureum]|eukprot:POR2888..scf229_5
MGCFGRKQEDDEDDQPHAALKKGVQNEPPPLDPAAAATFGVSAEALVNMIEERDKPALAEMGGVDGLLAALKSSKTKGMTTNDDELDVHRRAFGPNKFRYPPPKNFFVLVWEAFHDITVLILCVAAIISLTIGLAVPEKREEYGYIEGIAIVAVIAVVVTVQACIDYSKEKKFRQLNSVKDNYDVQVLRNGETLRVSAEEVVVGDIMKITAGDKLAADAVYVDGSNLKTNESAMTGEVVDINKNHEKDPFLLSGTIVSEGVGFVVVIAVGERSQWGIILSQLIVEPEATPLQERLDKLAMQIGWIGIIMATLTFFVSMIRWIVHSADTGNWDGTEVLRFFIDAVTIVVVAIPEGLPLAITLGLAFAMRKMMQDNNLVRRLEACETMGSATQLNADKTGTLTQNRMTVVQAYFGGASFVYKGAGEHIEARAESLGDAALPEAFKQTVALNVAVNSQANLRKQEDGTVEHLGNKTECALLQMVENWSMDYHALREQNPPNRIFLFSSAKKRMSTAIKSGEGVRLHCKGASEIVLRLCSSEMQADGTIRPLPTEEQDKVLAKVEAMASEGLRTLVLCYRDFATGHGIEWESVDDDGYLEQQMTLLGLVGIKDPIRPETRDAVIMLKKAGVTVRMVTGDNPLTAKFIATEAGILDGSEGPEALLEGPVFRKMSDEEKRRVALGIRVLARSSPTDKLLLVRQHKKLGEVVSVTGDGTNDAPALKEADVGFALGLAGTEIAKEACDIVILDDNIQSMAKAVLWGRNVYSSIRKFLQFQLVVNVVAVTLNFISACAGRRLPLGAVPLLWVNMIMDSMGALALATEPPRMSLMDNKPFGRRAPLINRAMFRNIFGVSIFQLTVTLVLMFAGNDIFNLGCFPPEFAPDEEFPCEGSTLKLNSLIFNTFVFMQIFNEINSRRIEERDVFSKILDSKLFCVIIVITILVQVALMLGVGQTRVGQQIGIVTISGAMWGTSIVIGLLALPVGFLVRSIPLDWCAGPLDDDITQMSKFEKFFHFPQRKEPVFEEDEEEEGDDESLMEDTTGARVPLAEVVDASKLASDRAQRLVKLRVYVHAVAFINVVNRAASSKKMIKSVGTEDSEIIPHAPQRVESSTSSDL